MTRQEAYKILNELIKSPNLIKHHLAAEAAMKGIADYLNMQRGGKFDTEKWGLVGLLHDADYETTKETPEKHTLVLEEKLKGRLDEDIIYAIKCHNYKRLGVEPKSEMDWAIYTCDELTGFIVACGLVSPNKKLDDVNLDFVLKKMRNPGFARAVDREQIKLCEEKLDIDLNSFIVIVLTSMKTIARDLGL